MLGDTIVALASPPGPGARAILRLSGPAAVAAVAGVFAPPPGRVRGVVDGLVRWRDAAVPAFAMVMPGPGSFTGEDVVELHVPGSPLLVELLLQAIVGSEPELGIRRALPGEFTRRAFDHGRLDLAQAEGVLRLVHAESMADAAAGLSWLHGGLAAAVAALRGELQDALATIESGLDFTDDETGAVHAADWQPKLQAARARAAALLAALPAATSGGELLLAGAANAGKSALVNALAGRTAVLVDGTAGTTRDLLRVEIGDGVVLWDAPGDLEQPAAIDRVALDLRNRLGGRGAAALLVIDPERPHVSLPPLPVVAVIWTKADRGVPAPAVELPAVPQFVVSATTGAGLAPLRAFLRDQCTGGPVPGSPIRACLAAVAAALSAAAVRMAPELAAVDLQGALAALDGIAGHHSPEDLLDRIFGRFCLGK
ncbi:MAG: 50S ribosome-binding GTPase [Planctomycetes bacterium]|nr:50S ribosome-binding GTPase [Planctomycetota bacterium]